MTGLGVYNAMRSCAAGRSFDMSAIWKAESFAATQGQPMTVRRAEALNAVLRQCDLFHAPGELLVGSHLGRYVPPSPDLQARCEQVCPLLDAVGSRSFLTHADHHAPDYPTLLRLGLVGLKSHAEVSLARHADPGRQTFLRSVEIALDGAAEHLGRWARHLLHLAEMSVKHAALLDAQARMVARLAKFPPRSFWEAVQLVWIVHSMIQCDNRWAMALGRVDQYLYPFYRADLEVGRINREAAQGILDHLFGKLTGLGGDIQNVTIGGLVPEGRDATNELSYMMLKACRRVGRPGGNLTARIHAGTPQAFLLECARLTRTGIGYPALVNDEVLVPALVEQDYPVEDARDYCFVGCIETFIPGRMAPWADSRFNLLYCVNLAIFRGIDSLTGRQVGPDTGESATWQQFYEAFLVQLRYGLRQHIDELNACKQPVRENAADYTSPLLSALTADCIDRGLDLNDGGARYPANHGIAAMGIGVTADALAAVKRFVYDRQQLSLEQLRAMLAANFEGCEPQRQCLLRQAPKYGNNDPEVDAIAVDVTRAVGQECLKYRNPQGGRYWALMAANVQNVSAGREVGASPDGRLSGQPLSDAASPTFGRDCRGPTAAIHSISKLPYHLCPGGNVVNMKFHPSAVAGEEGLNALASLVRVCFRRGGAQLQFNTVDRRVLIAAMEQPAEYGNLVVRVSGFSAQFVSLDRAVQEDILARTEHGL